MAKKTPEEIAAMEREVREYREAEAQAALAAARETAAPMQATVDDGSLTAVQEALAALEPLAADKTRFPTLRAALNAATVGLDAVRECLVKLAPPAVSTQSDSGGGGSGDPDKPK